MSRASRVASLAGLVLLAAVGCAPAKDHEKGAPVLELSTTALAFTAPARGASPEHQVVTATNGGTGTLALPVATVTYTSGAGWLSATVTGTEAPYHVIVVPSVAGLSPGSYAASVAVSSPGAGGARTVAVTFLVGAEQPAVLSLSGSSLAFTGILGDPAPAAQTLVASNTGSGHLPMPAATVTYGSGSGWLTVRVTGFGAPYTVKAQPSLAGLAPGDYAATVSVASAGALSSPRTFSVTLSVLAKPVIVLSPAAVDFTAVQGGAAPDAQVVTVTNAGAAPGVPLAVPTATVAASAAGWLSATVAGTAPPYTVTVQATPGALAPGLHGTSVVIAAAGAESAKTLGVSLTVFSQPVVGLSTPAVDFRVTPGATAPVTQVITVDNAGAAPSMPLAPPTATVAYPDAGGWLSATVTGTAAPYTVTLEATPGALAPGIHAATVTLDAPGSVGSRVIPVTLDLRFAYTVFVYGNADNNLSAGLLTDIQEMDAAALGPDVAVIVAADWSHGRTAPDGTLFPAGTEWFRIAGGGQGPVLVGTSAEQSFDDPAVLRDSLGAVLDAYPAHAYGVVLWDHGGSWAGGFGGDESDTPDDPSDDGSGMKAADAAGAISAALAAAGVTGPRPLEFLGFDTCLMAGNEVAWEVRDLAKVYLADAELDFGDGWDYAAALGWLAANPAAPPADFAAAEVAAWDAQHLASGGADDTLLRSHVALDLASLDAYAAAWGTLSAALSGSAALDWVEVGRAQLAAAPGYGTSFDDPSDSPDLRDAGQLLDGLGAVTSDAAVAAAAQGARAALTAAVVQTSSGDLRIGQAGVHAEAPLPASWAARRADYVGLGWSVATGWAGALDALGAHADAVAPAVTTGIANDLTPTAALPPTLTLTIPPSDLDVAEAQVFLQGTLGGTEILYGIVAEGTVEAGASYTYAWNGSVAAIGDGTGTSAATLLPWIRGATPVYVVRGLLSSGEVAYGIADLSAGVISTLLVEDVGRLAAFEVADFRGLAFTPLVWDLTAEQWVAGTTLAIADAAGATLTLGSVPAPAGAYALVTVISDVWGNAGAAADAVTVATPFYVAP